MNPSKVPLSCGTVVASGKVLLTASALRWHDVLGLMHGSTDATAAAKSRS